VELAPEVLTLHYWLPDTAQMRRLCAAVVKCTEKPCLIADAASMYSAKVSGLARFFDVFTPDAAELAFLADSTAPHPAYVKFMTCYDSARVPELIGNASRNRNLAVLTLVKGSADYIVKEGVITTTVNEPDVPAMEPIGGTGDTITGMLSAFIGAGLEPLEAAVIAAKANRMAGKIANVNPATRIGKVIAAFPGVFKQYLCEWSGVCIDGGIKK
jgi:NAD(P)H-hydrate repair Nnr-like enzyme with NAD(P)H-hydrate dehydratase domain